MGQQRTEEWDQDVLSREIHDKTWAGEYWGCSGVIRLARRRFRAALQEATTDHERASAYSSLSSTYYSAAGNAYAWFKAVGIFTKTLWAFRALWCRRKAVNLSDEVEYVLGLEKMTIDQLDVRSTILRRVGRYAHALVCVEEALSRPNICAESRVLLLVGRVEIFDHQGRAGEADDAINAAMSLFSQVRPQTQVRLYKARGRHDEQTGYCIGAIVAYKRALSLAREIGGMEDQEMKLEMLLARLFK